MENSFRFDPGSVYLPSLPVSVPIKSNSRPASARSFNTEVDCLSSRPISPVKPKLLNNVVFEHELDGIVNRLSRSTMSSRMKNARFRPKVTFVSMDYYNWHRMPSFSEHHGMIYTPDGAVRESFKKTTKRPYTAVPPQYRVRIPTSVW